MMAQMGGPATAVRAHEEIFAYWASRRQGARLPSRASIHPEDFKRHLPTISLIDVIREPRAYRQRLAGTGLYGVYGREITGRTLDEVYNGFRRPNTGASSWTRWSSSAGRASACTISPGAGGAPVGASGCACRWRATARTWT